MKKSLAASKDIMQHYLSELLTDNEAVQAPTVTTDEIDTENAIEKQRLEKLLNNVSEEKTTQVRARNTAEDIAKTPAVIETEPAKVEPIVAPVIAPVPVKKEVRDEVKEQAQLEISTQKSQGKLVADKKKDYREGSFQAMFFDVAGLIIAVPLIELGGIHNTDKTTSLMGKPDWFKGVMLHREDKINVVDTALWVMPEKCNDTLMNSLNYQYVIMLGNSKWGLMAEHLVDTVTLTQEEVKWLDKPSKRPWLAGLVKERMCALLDVEALIKLLDDGAGIEK